jgi:putative ABC transport system substrate-binding protein
MIRRREFIALLGGAPVSWPLAARAQQSAVPVIGFLGSPSSDAYANIVAAFRVGLGEAGYVEGQNVAIEYRWALNESSRLSELAADLVRHRVSAIAAIGALAALAVRAATATIPIVFTTEVDPVETGLVASLNQPGSNVTGISGMGVELVGKQLGLLHDLMPGATRFAVLVNPIAKNAEPIVINLKAAASAFAVQLEVFNATTNREIDTAFATLVQNRLDAVIVSSVPLFVSRRVQLATLATHYALPAIFTGREYAEAGGLMSYAASRTDEARQAGIYTGRVLKGEKPTDLPVMRAVKFEFIINLQTARTLNIDIPAKLLAIADEVIE